MSFANLVTYLQKNNLTIATMESCTGGLIASSITDIMGASSIIKFSAVTYSEEYKIKMGVKEETIKKYSVYSKEVAKEMAYNIALFASSDIGVGVTGKLASLTNEDSSVDICLYDKRTNTFTHRYQLLKNQNRLLNKQEVLEIFLELFNSTYIS